MDNFKTSGYAAVNGLNMYYEIYGSGTMPLLLIHGGGSTIESTFGNILPLLYVNRKVITVELQAHGRTSDREAPESFEQDADDVAALLKHLMADKADILGFSNGGTTTLQLAIRHPQLINKIVVVSANYQRSGIIAGLFEGLRNATIADMPAALKEAYLKVAPDKNGLQVMFEKDKERMLNFKDIPDESIRTIKVPALFMVADRDVVMAEHVVKLSRLVDGARLAVLPGTHGAIIGEVGSEKEGSKIFVVTATLINEFLNG